MKDVIAQVEELPVQGVAQKMNPIEGSTSVRPAKNSQGSKAPSKTRRKLQLDDDVDVLPKPKKTTPQSGGLEDTFIFGLKPKKRQPKSKLKEMTEEDSAHQETETAPAPVKKKRTAKEKQQANDEDCGNFPGNLNEEVVVPEKKPSKSNGKHRSKIGADALHVDVEPLKEKPPPQMTGADPVKEKSLESMAAKPKATAPKAAKSKAAAKKASKRTMEDVVEDETATGPESTAKRPRRQAAISATEKVAQGYEEELVPADKLRRAAEPVAKRGRPKKVVAPDSVPVLPPYAPPSILKLPLKEVQRRSEEEVPIAKARSVGRPRKLGAKIAKVDIAATEKEPVDTSPRPGVEMPVLDSLQQVVATEILIQEAQPVKKARKVRARVVAHKTPMDDEPAIEPCEVEQKRCRTWKAPGLKTSGKVNSKASKSTDTVDEEIAVVEEMSEGVVIPETQRMYDVNDDSNSLAGGHAEGSRDGRAGEQNKKSRRVLAESDVNTVRSLPTDDLGLIIKPTIAKHHHSDQVTVKPAIIDYIDTERARVKQPGRKTRTVPAINPATEHEDNDPVNGPAPIPSVEVVNTKRARKTRPAQQSKPPSAIEPPHDKAVTPKRRHVIAADEDLDWLFEKNESKRPRVPARNPRASSKVNQQAPVKKSADAKDMDLDDLLESIAGFSGKLLTGKSGRAMASR